MSRDPARVARTEPRPLSILVVDDEPMIRSCLAAYLERTGQRCAVAEDGNAALAALRDAAPDLVFLDICMPGMTGLETLRRMREEGYSGEAVIVSANLDIPRAVEAFRHGACDLIEKPFSFTRIAEAIEVARGRIEAGQAHAPVSPAAPPPAPVKLVGRSAAIADITGLIARVGPTESTVLIEGETGTGKEVVARAIHWASPRRTGPFVAVNCGALPETLAESELFGHEKGAFTGAAARNPGLFRAADGGTLVLDELGDLPLPLQLKLLRAIQEREVLPIGGVRPVRVDVRIIGATNRDLEQAVTEGTFRRDLFYRLNVIRIVIPPLRARPDDLEPLADHFVALLNRRYGRSVPGLEPGAVEVLRSYAFPGNARELENVIERAFALGATDRIRAEDLPYLRPAPAAGAAAAGVPVPGVAAAAAPGTAGVGGAVVTMDEAERLLIERTLKAVDGNRTKAAAVLGISAKTISRKCKQYGIGN